MTRRLIIIGGGLAGSILANDLCSIFATTVIELREDNRSANPLVTDDAWPAGLDIHIGSGPGGTTQFWNNGLMEMEDDDFSSWPVRHADLRPYIEQAYPLLCGVTKSQVDDAYARLRDKYIERGVPASLLGNPLFYPRRRRNLWRSLGLSRKSICYVVGRASHLVTNGAGSATGVSVVSRQGSHIVEGDVFVCCAGGLSSPLIVQETNRRDRSLPLSMAGCFYSDHPMGLIAEVRLNRKLYDVWNYTEKRLAGAIQCPLVTRHSSGIKTASFLRPAGIVRHGERTNRLRSVLVDLRNAPFKPSNVLKFLGNVDDIREVVSFKLGLHVPTDNYVIRFVAGQPPAPHMAIHGEAGRIHRNWQLGADYRQSVKGALDQLIDELGDLVLSAKPLVDWDLNLHSSAHHSGACRMALDVDRGVCDGDCQINGLRNAFICDGSVIPESGFTNTGLTIGALALRLAHRLRAHF